MRPEDETGQKVQKLRELIEKVEVAMLTTVEEDGSLRSRPMMTPRMELDGDLWFLTRFQTAKVEEISRDQHVNLSWMNAADGKFVSVSGKASVVRDREKVKKLWTTALKDFFPNGPEDPELVLLRVDLRQAEYWDGPGAVAVESDHQRVIFESEEGPTYH